MSETSLGLIEMLPLDFDRVLRRHSRSDNDCGRASGDPEKLANAKSAHASRANPTQLCKCLGNTQS